MQIFMNIHREGGGLSRGEEGAGALEDGIVETSKDWSLYLGGQSMS